jgi:hypothetical protein
MKVELRVLSRSPRSNLLPHARDGLPKDYYASLHFANRAEVHDAITRLQQLMDQMPAPNTSGGVRFRITEATVIDDSANIFL